jgi:hypothetical protein
MGDIKFYFRGEPVLSIEDVSLPAKHNITLPLSCRGENLRVKFTLNEEGNVLSHECPVIWGEQSFDSAVEEAKAAASNMIPLADSFYG